MSEKSENRIEIAHFKWGPAGEDGVTDTTWFYLVHRSNGCVRILEYSTGPEIEQLYGHYDHESWIDVSADQHISLIGLLAGSALSGEAPDNFEELKDACDNWGIECASGERDAAPDTKNEG